MNFLNLFVVSDLVQFSRLVFVEKIIFNFKHSSLFCRSLYYEFVDHRSFELKVKEYFFFADAQDK
jgi:hypothetical protein